LNGTGASFVLAGVGWIYLGPAVRLVAFFFGFFFTTFLMVAFLLTTIS